MKWVLALAFIISWSLFMHGQGYKSCKLEFVETQQAQYEATIEKLIQAREEVAQQAQRYRDAAAAVRTDADRLRHELKAAQSRARDKRPTPPENTGGRTETMAAVLDRATAIIAERDAIALQYNELREQCRLR